MNGIRHVGIYVNNLEKMKEFYCDEFAMDVVTHDFEKGSYISCVLGCEGIGLELYKLRSPNGTILELIKCSNDSTKTPSKFVYYQNCMHVALTVENIEALYKKLKDKIEFISEPKVSDSGLAKVCFCKDLEGNYLELVEEL